MSYPLASETQTQLLAKALAKASNGQGIIYLSGGLGAGKTNFSRGVIQSLGHKGVVKSPTFTLVEPYFIDNITIYHMDLYRFNDPEEFNYLGFDDFQSGLFLIEWPEKGQPWLPDADLLIILELKSGQHALSWQAKTKHGKLMADALTQAYHAL